MANAATKPSGLQKHVFDFDIDNYLNPICPRQRFYLLPTFVSYWFGYRSPNAKSQPKLPNLGVWFSAFLGGFVGIAIITNVYAHLPLLGEHQAPLVIASFGAAAVLEYNTIESPLSQPRNLILGHFLSALIGVAITKAFETLPQERFLELRWLAGSIAVGLASFVMGATKTVHPPAGATALLAATSTEITALGWWLLPLVLLGSTLMCASAQLINNMTRRWPLYWWTPADLSSKKPDIQHVKDVENQKVASSDSDRTVSDAGSLRKVSTRHIETVNPNASANLSQMASDLNQDRKSENTLGDGDSSQEYTQRDELSNERATRVDSHVQRGLQRQRMQTEYDARNHEILIMPDSIVLPDWYEASEWEREVLEDFRQKLAMRLGQ